MKVSLVSLPITSGRPEVNQAKMEQLLRSAVTQGAELVCFPEMAIVNDGYPWGKYRHLAQPIPGEYSDTFCRLARECGVHISLGLMEATPEGFYSSAILISPDGRIILKHRQVRSGKPYVCGDAFNCVESGLGPVMFAICADIWDDGLLTRVAQCRPRYTLVPADLCGNENERGLITDERPPDDLLELKERYRTISEASGGTVLVANCYEEDGPEYCGAFGGAFAFDKGVEVLPLGLTARRWRQPVEQPIYSFAL